MANWNEPKNDYKKEDQVVPEIFNTLAENERYLQEKKITTDQVQDAEVTSTQATSRENLGDKETVKGFFGKIRKWFADLKALAFKGTVGTSDIDASAVTSAKIASSAVTSTKIGTSAVTTAKIADKAVTDAKIDSVSASKVTGLAKVATSGSYNDLTDKPSSSGGGFNFTKYEFYPNSPPSSIEEGVYLAFAVFENAGSYSNVVSFGGITYSPDIENGAFSNISSVIYDGEEMKVQLHISSYNGKPIFSIKVSDNQKGCPYRSFDADGSFRITLYRLSDLGTISKDDASGEKTWLELSGSVDIYGDSMTNSVEVPFSGLKVGDEIECIATNVKIGMDMYSDAYWFNALDGNEVYGWTWNGYEWEQYQYYDDWSIYPNEKRLTSASSFVAECGIVEYGTPNKLTIKISCKRNGYLTVEWSDQAGCYIENMTLYGFYVCR